MTIGRNSTFNFLFKLLIVLSRNIYSNTFFLSHFNSDWKSRLLEKFQNPLIIHLTLSFLCYAEACISLGP